MTRRVEVGFEGGQTVRLTMAAEALDALTAALPAGGWQRVEADEGSHWLNVDDVVFVRVPPGEAPPRVGFGG